MTQWEYKVLTIDADRPGLFNMTGGQIDGEVASRELNRLGLHGWELVTAFDTNFVQGATRNVVLLFKRPAAAAAIPTDGGPEA